LEILIYFEPNPGTQPKGWFCHQTRHAAGTHLKITLPNLVDDGLIDGVF